MCSDIRSSSRGGHERGDGEQCGTCIERALWIMGERPIR